MDTHNECAICLGDCITKTIHLTPCNHEFHHDCITKWLNKNSTCPLCRARACIPIANHKKPRKRTKKMIVLEAIELKIYGLLFTNHATVHRYAMLYGRICTAVHFSCKPGCEAVYENLKKIQYEFCVITPEVVETILAAFKFLHPDFTV